MRTDKRRFDIYQPDGDLGSPETVGLLPHDKEWDLGTPNLARAENLSVVAAHSSLNRCLTLRMKWRPDAAGNSATVVSRLALRLNGNDYEFAQVESYKPEVDTGRRPGRLLQYGSSASRLKLLVISPYRRVRLVFNGYMRHVGDEQGPLGGDNEEPRLVHVKLNCLLLSTSDVFDFYDQLDPSCAKQICNEAKLSKGFDWARSNLFLHDRHEQRVRLIGEYQIIDRKNEISSMKIQDTLEIRGHYTRHFLTSNEELHIDTVRLYAFLENGQGFQIGTRRSEDNEIKFGYTAFLSFPATKYIDKPFQTKSELNSNLQKFSLTVSGQQSSFECTGERRFGSWFAISMNEKRGWAWLSTDDELKDSPADSAAIERSRNELGTDLDAGRLCSEAQLDAALKPLVVSIEDDGCSSSGLVGAKAASLAQLHKLATATGDGCGYQVPHAFVLTRFAHDLLLEESPKLREAINGLSQLVAAGDSDGLKEQCKTTRELVASCSLPQKVADELWQRVEATHPAEAAFAVRSSSWGEDEADMSAAGQLASVLSVGRSRDELARAVLECFASKFSSENVEYKRQHGQPLDLPMAVVVQRMVACDRAGVMFTCDPTSGDESAVTITANYGLGESVVSAAADPDSVRVRVGSRPADYSLASGDQTDGERKLEIEEVRVGKKELVIGGHGGGYDRTKCCLDDEQILRLARCGLAVRRYFWSQQRDIEWGFKDGQLFLFQSRPVTGLDSFTETELLHEFDRTGASELNFYSRANIGEVLPHAQDPLSATSVMQHMEATLNRFISELTQGEIRFVPHTSNEWQRQKYHNLIVCTNSMWLSLDKQTVLTKSMEIGLFGREVGPRPDIIEATKGIPRAPEPLKGPLFKLKTWRLRLIPVQTVEKELPRALKIREDVRSLSLATGYESNKLLGLYNQFLATMRYDKTAFLNHVIITMMSSERNFALTAFLSKYIEDAKQLCAASNRFLAITPDVLSAQIPKRVRQVAELVRASDQHEAFANMPPKEALQHLLSSEAEGNKPIKEAFEDFMQTFGHRCYDEFMLSVKSWREQPTEVVKMIQKNCQAMLGQEIEMKEDNRDKTIDDVIKSLRLDLSFKDKLLLKHRYVPECQLMLSLREKTKNVLILDSDIRRECARLLAAEMVRQQRIPDEDLLFYVALEELKPLCLDHQPAIVMQAVRRRQLFRKMFSEVWKFDEIFSEVVPNHLKPTRELDEAIAQAPKLFGTPASSGKVRGTLCRVDGYQDLDKVRPGTILLTHSTDIAFSPVFPMISGIITEVGGLVSHGAVVAREYGLPSLIGIPDVMRILQDGEEIILDADNGVIVRLSKDSNSSSSLES